MNATNRKIAEAQEKVRRAEQVLSKCASDVVTAAMVTEEHKHRAESLLEACARELKDVTEQRAFLDRVRWALREIEAEDAAVAADATVAAPAPSTQAAAAPAQPSADPEPTLNYGRYDTFPGQE